MATKKELELRIKDLLDSADKMKIDFGVQDDKHRREIRELKDKVNKESMDHDAKEIQSVTTIGELRDRVRELETQAEYIRNTDNQRHAETTARLTIAKQVLEDALNQREF